MSTSNDGGPAFHTRFPDKKQKWFHPHGGEMTLVKPWAKHSDFTEWVCENASGKRCIRVLDLMYPMLCPVTGLHYWGHVTHPQYGSVPTYGGPFDTYMVPERTGEIGADDEWTVERYDQDAAQWLIEGFLPVERSLLAARSAKGTEGKG